MFFAGRLPTPPWETRSRVEAMVKQLDNAPLENYGVRFRFSTLRARHVTLVDLWDRGLRALEEGRPGPLARRRDETPAPRPPAQRVVHVAAFRDPPEEVEKLRSLYDAVVEARREIGKEPVPFPKFAELVKSETERLKAGGSREVSFRVAVAGGKVSLTARPLKVGSE